MAAYHCPNCLAAYRLDVAHCPRDGGDLVCDDDPLIGVVLGDRYQVEALLGEGGMARVYRVLHLGLQKTFALKAVYGDLAMDPRMAARFELEARAASRLDHPNIVSTVDFAATSDGLLFLVLEYLEGQDLGHILLERGPLPPAEALNYYRQMLRGIAHAHARNLVHRDLKPDNLFIVPRDGHNHLKIVDFGLAHLVDTRAEESDRMTRAGEIFGTPEFMSPEQVRGGEITPATDLYASGIILYQLLTGRTPFASDNPTDTLLKQCTAEPPSLDPELPAQLNELIGRLLCKEPERRPPSAVLVLEQTEGIESVLHEAPAVSSTQPMAPASRTASVPPPLTLTRRVLNPRGKHFWLGVLSAATSVGSGAFFLHSALRREPAPNSGFVAAATLTAVGSSEGSGLGGEDPFDDPGSPADSSHDVDDPGLEPRSRPDTDTTIASNTVPEPTATRFSERAAERRRARAKRDNERWLRRGEALLTANGLSTGDLELTPRLEQAWSKLNAAARSGEAGEADHALDELGNAVAAFGYPRALLKRKIERLYRRIDAFKGSPEAGLLRALLDAEVLRLPGTLANREGRLDLWREVGRLERQAAEFE